MFDLPAIQVVQKAQLEADTGVLWLTCKLVDGSEQLIKIDPNAFATWVQALHSMPAGTSPKHGRGRPLTPIGCRPIVLQDKDAYGLAFQIRPGIEIQMLFPPAALPNLKACIAQLEALGRQAGTA